MEKSANELATRLLASEEDSLEDLRIHHFKNDEEAHDDDAMDRLYADFNSHFEQVQAELSASYGEPLRVGTDNDGNIPLCGVFRFAIWDVEGRLLYAAVAHEDRECPILLMLGATAQ